jgi:hypothetical protein
MNACLLFSFFLFERCGCMNTLAVQKILRMLSATCVAFGGKCRSFRTLMV